MPKFWRAISQLWIVACVCMSMCAAHATISVDPLIYEFVAHLQTQNISVLNNSTRNAYVKTRFYEVIDPLSAKKKRIPQPRTAGFLIAPSKLIVKPNGKARIRVTLYRQPDEKEHIYQLLVKPVPPPTKIKQSAVQLTVSYATRLVVRPRHPRVSIQAARDKNRVRIQNNGNTSVIIADVVQCQGETTQCHLYQDLKKTVYPGERYTFIVEKDAPITFTQSAMGQKRTRRL